MFDLIRSNLFLMKKSRSTYIMTIIAIATTAITILSNALLIALLHEPAEDNDDENGVSVTMTADYEDATSDDPTMTGTVGTLMNAANKNSYSAADILTMMTSGMNLLLPLSIYLVIFANSDSKNGYIKNLGGCVARRKIVLAKLICSAVYTIFAMLISWGVSMAIAKAVIESKCKVDVVFGSGEDFAKALGIQLLSHITIAAVIIMVIMITRSTAVSIAFGVALSSGIPTLLYQVADMVLHKYVDISDDFSIADYVPSNAITGFSPAQDSDTTTRMIVVCVIYLVIATVIGIALAGGTYCFDSMDNTGVSTSFPITMEDFYAVASQADVLIYNATIGTPLTRMSELLAKDSLFADFKAVQTGDVYCTGKGTAQSPGSCR